jgi:hypothetical protein
VLSSILQMYGISDDKFAEVCVIVDKLDKIGAEETVALLVGKQVRDRRGVECGGRHARHARGLRGCVSSWISWTRLARKRRLLYLWGSRCDTGGG